MVHILCCSPVSEKRSCGMQKDTRINVRITAEEKKVYQKLVKSLGAKSLSDLCRLALKELGREEKMVVRVQNTSQLEPSQEYSKTLQEVITYLRKTGNNLNQIARQLNSGYQVNNIDQVVEDLHDAILRLGR